MAFRIEQEQIEAAEERARFLEEQRDAASEALVDTPNSEEVTKRVTASARRAAQARATARELRKEYNEQLAAERAQVTREEREKGAAKEIAAAGKELKAARAELEAAGEAAQRGLEMLMKAAEMYDALVQQHAETLAGAGLGLDGESGGASRFPGWAVKARGVCFESAGSGAVLACVAHRVAEARLPYPNVMVGILQYNVGRVVPEERADGLFGKLPAPEPLKFPVPLRLQNSFQAEGAVR